MRLPGIERHPAQEDETNEGAETRTTRLPGAVVLEDLMTVELPDGSAVCGDREGVENEVVGNNRDRQHRAAEEARLVSDDMDDGNSLGTGVKQRASVKRHLGIVGGWKLRAIELCKDSQNHEDSPEDLEARLEVPGAFHEDGALPREPDVPRILPDGQVYRYP